MKTKRINGQRFIRIEYTNHGAHPPMRAWYPAVNLRWLARRCDVKVVGGGKTET